MYQGLVFVNRIAPCFGQYAGNDNDAKTVMWGGIVQLLHNHHDVAIEAGMNFSRSTDSVYPAGRYMQVIQKCQQGGQLSQTACWFNTLMVHFRVYNENLFTETDTIQAALQNKTKQN